MSVSGSTSIRCPHCNNKLVQKSESGVRIRITGQVVVDADGLVKSQCYWCSTPVTVPLELSKSFSTLPSPRLVIKPIKS